MSQPERTVVSPALADGLAETQRAGGAPGPGGSPDPGPNPPPSGGPAGWRPPGELGEYRLERFLGKGTMGQVWLARDNVLDRRVAIKFATGDGTPPSEEERARFRLEARAIARLRHPNVISVHHAGEVDGCPYLVT